MNKLLTILFACLLVALSTSSCSEEKDPVNYGEVLSGQWKKNTNCDDYSAETIITLRNTFTCVYSQTISVDGEKIHNTMTGEWQYNEETNHITIVFTDSRENIRHEETGTIDIANGSMTIDNNVFTRLNSLGK